MKYVVYDFRTREENERDWLVALLSEFDFEGFEETGDSLKAYVPVDKATPASVQQILTDNELQHITFSTKDLEDKNWNEEWEKNFEPVVIVNRVGIRAPFHQPLNTEYEIVIEPKMSFGTGHHATTASVIQLMLEMDFAGKNVLDFGSGTGVLAILAEKLNAEKLLAIDNEEWAYNNCVENIATNNCSRITCIHGDDSYSFSEKFDIILANINRHVILNNLKNWKQLLALNGVLIVSGILQNAESIVLSEAMNAGLQKTKIVENNGWLAIAFQLPQ